MANCRDGKIGRGDRGDRVLPTILAFAAAAAAAAALLIPTDANVNNY